MKAISDIIARYVQLGSSALAETLWPSRCIVCDRPGEVLCISCRQNLSYLDLWRACPRCGAPQGRIQCTECNPISLARLQLENLSFDACISSTLFDEASARIIRGYKDQGERRLAPFIAQLMSQSLPPSWLKPKPFLVGIPASKSALRRRGFDHMEEIIKELACFLALEIQRPLERPRSADQRGLGRKARFGNVAGRFKVSARVEIGSRYLLVDDVFTTGATLIEASEALKAAGANQVFCLSFARVW